MAHMARADALMKQFHSAVEMDGEKNDWLLSIHVPTDMKLWHVRRALCEQIRSGSASGANLADAELIVGELVANMERHASGVGSFHLEWRGRCPRLLVLDDGPGFSASPSFEPPDAFAESGRGLDLISSLGLGVRLGNDPAGGAFVLVTLPVDGAAAQPL